MIEPPQEYWETDPKGHKVSWLEFIVYQTVDILVWAFKIGLSFYFISLIYSALYVSIFHSIAINVCQYIK